MSRILVSLAALALLTTGSIARAQPAGAHEHDGFFLQLDLGGGGMATTTSILGADLTVSGGAGQLSVAVGGAVARNFILAGQLWGASATEPEVKVNGQSLGSLSDATLSLTAVGLNLTYYFMPINIYVSATPSVGTLSVKQRGQSADTKSGFALRLAVGKEWWVSVDWGIGLNLQFAHASNQSQGTNAPTWATNWIGLAFSATYN